MIEHIRTIGFKGFDLDEDVPQKVIYSGPNKSGKSTRAGVIALALYGHIPFSTAGKRPGDILDSFGGDSLIAAVTIGGKEFGRKFSRNEKGGVSQSVQFDKKRVSAENFAVLLNKAGAPRIANTAEFMQQSEAKKIDTLFDLYPNPELSGIDSEIEEAKEDVSQWQKKKVGAESTVVRLTNSKQGVEMPSGNISEVQAEIKSVEAKISGLEWQIKQAEIEEATAEAERKAQEKADIEAKKKATEIEEAEIKAKAEGERQERDRADKESAARQDEHPKTESPTEPSDYSVMRQHNGDIVDKVLGIPTDKDHAIRLKSANEGDSIQRIIEALNGSGCGTCAALIVAKQELKKFKELS